MSDVFLDSKFSDQCFLEHVVSELYDFSKVGGLFIPDAINENKRAIIESEMKSIPEESFEKLEGKSGNVYFDLYQYDPINMDPIIFLGFPQTMQFVGEFNRFLSRLGNLAGFKTQGTSPIFHRYDAENYGISKHKDNNKNWHTITSANISGLATFGFSSGPQYDTTPGSMIIMRAQRRPEEFQYHPEHYIRRFREKRYAIILRDLER